MDQFSEQVLSLFQAIHPLDRVPRSGFLLRGVTEPESVSAHSHFLALLVLLVTDRSPEAYDQKKALAMALIHDLSEAKTMDIPMPVGDRYLKEAKTGAEQHIIDTFFKELAPQYAEYHRELVEGRSPEARLVRALDKVQMMIKIINYENENRGNLREFWDNENNFNDYGIPAAAELFAAVRKRGRC